jgi:hypothetical protein
MMFGVSSVSHSALLFGHILSVLSIPPNVLFLKQLKHKTPTIRDSFNSEAVHRGGSWCGSHGLRKHIAIAYRSSHDSQRRYGSSSALLVPRASVHWTPQQPFPPKSRLSLASEGRYRLVPRARL